MNKVKDILVACSSFKKNLSEPSLYSSSINHLYNDEETVGIIRFLEKFINDNITNYKFDDSNIFIQKIKDKSIKNMYDILDLHYERIDLYYNLIAIDPLTTRLNYINDSSPLKSDFREFVADLESSKQERVVIDTDNYIDNYETLLSYIEKNPRKEFDVIYFAGCWFNPTGLGSLFDLGRDTYNPKSNYYDPKHGDCKRIKNILKTMFSNLKRGGLFIYHSSLIRKERQMLNLNIETRYNSGVDIDDIPTFIEDILLQIDETITIFKNGKKNLGDQLVTKKITDDYDGAIECLKEIKEYFRNIFTDGTFIPLIDINIPIYVKF